MNKAMSVKEYHVCDAKQAEIRQLMKDKVKLEKQLAELQKKEAKSK